MTVRQCLKSRRTNLSLYGTYKENIGKLLRRKVNGKSCKNLLQKSRKSSEKHHVMHIKNTSALSIAYQHVYPSQKTLPGFVDQMTLATPPSVNDLKLAFIYSRAYSRVFDATDYVTSECRYVKQNTWFLTARNRNFVVQLRAVGTHRGRMRYSISHCRPSSAFSSSPGSIEETLATSMIKFATWVLCYF